MATPALAKSVAAALLVTCMAASPAQAFTFKKPYVEEGIADAAEDGSLKLFLKYEIPL